MRKLSEGQAEVLRLLGTRNVAIDGAMSTPEISRRLRKRFDDWSRGKLVALEKRGFVARLGTTFSNGQCWGITSAGLFHLGLNAAFNPSESQEKAQALSQDETREGVEP